MSVKVKKVLKEIERQGHMMIVGPEKGEVLVKLLKKYKPKRILEVGTYVGYSAILMADAADKKTKIVTIEVDKENARVARKNIKQAELKSRIKVKVGDAKKIIPKLKSEFDFMFIDAVKEDYLNYLKLAEDRLEKEAIVVADNVKVFKDEMKDYLSHVRDSGKYQSKNIEVGIDALELSVLI